MWDTSVRSQRTRLSCGQLQRQKPRVYDLIGVDAGCLVEGLAGTGLAEFVDAEGDDGNAEDGAEEGERVRGAVLDRDDGSAALLLRDERRQVAEVEW